MIEIILLVAHRVASVIPLTLLALAFAFAIVVGVIWPSQARQEMVELLGTALKDFGSGMSRPPAQRPGRRGLSHPSSDDGQ
jgi:hypothetical protein